MDDKIKGYRGKFFWKERWFSICSAHIDFNKDCKACNAGYWTNVWGWKISGVVSKLFPKFWIYWMNRPNSKARKQIMELFPKLKK
jgi:hypothetical protein